MKKLYYIIIAIAVLVVFFFPKACGNHGTAVDPSAVYKDCTCIGLIYYPEVPGGSDTTCFGVPTSYECYYYTSSKEGPGRIPVSCE